MKKTPAKKTAAPVKKTAAVTMPAAVAKPAAARKTGAGKGADLKAAGGKVGAKSAGAKAIAAKPAAVKPAAKSPAVAVKAAAKPTAAKPAARKPVAAKKPTAAPKQPAAPEASDDAAETEVYTLNQLVTRYGAATEADVARYIEETPEALLLLGARVSTDRIDTDCARIYGQAATFFHAASPTQRAALFGCSGALLRTAIWAAQRGHNLWAERTASTTASNAEKTHQQNEAQLLRRRGQALRDSWQAGLRAIAAGAPRRLDEIATAYGTAEDNGALADALRRLAALGKRYAKDAKLRAGAAEAGLDDAMLGRTETLAAELARVGEVATAVRPRSKVAQNEVDRWDGINLTLLRRIMDIFEAGHLVDPSVPRLVPISLQRFFTQPRPKKGAPAPGGPGGEA